MTEIIVLMLWLTSPSEEAARLIKQMGSENFRTREVATAKLVKMDSWDVYCRLKDATGHKDLEICWRAKFARERILRNYQVKEAARKAARQAYVESERYHHEGWIQSLGVLPQLDSMWYNTKFGYYENYQPPYRQLYEFFGPYFSEASRLPQQNTSDPYDNYRKATRLAIADARTYGVPKWVIKLVLAEMWRREDIWAGRSHIRPIERTFVFFNPVPPFNPEQLRKDLLWPLRWIKLP